MMPTPTPAPPMPMQAIPAPIYFAATGSIIDSFVFQFGGPSMARVNCIVEIDAGEDGEDISLQECDQGLQREEDDDHREWKHSADPADDAKARAEQNNEASEDLKRDVSGQHVGKQTHAV